MLKKTPLYEIEKKYDARFTEFAGWELPLYYSGIVEEHMAVRKSAGIFDISHLGKIRVAGYGASDYLQFMVTNDISKASVGKGIYGLFCNAEGGIIDDDIIYRLDEEEYLIVTNASQAEIMLRWLDEHRPDGIKIIDDTEYFCLIALQGPQSPGLLRLAFGENPADYKRYTVKIALVNGNKVTIAKAGYTGEEGYEILCEVGLAGDLWRKLIEDGATPAGLGARDTLRLEMGFPLYGNDITTETSPVEAGLGKFVSFNKGDFIGRKPLLDQAEKGTERILAGFVVEHGIARRKDSVIAESGDEIGVVTSGGYSPILKKGIGLAYVKIGAAQVGNEVNIISGRKLLNAKIEKPPFIKVGEKPKGEGSYPAA